MCSTQGCTALRWLLLFRATTHPASISQTFLHMGAHTVHTHSHTQTHIHTVTQSHTHSPMTPSPPPRWLCAGSTLAAGHLLQCPFQLPPDGGPAGRGLPGGAGREECAPAPSPIWPPSGPICFPLPDTAASGLPEPVCRGVKFMWPGLEPAVTGPHTGTETHTGHPPPILSTCTHAHAHTHMHTCTHVHARTRTHFSSPSRASK